jgi:hypothetical protein
MLTGAIEASRYVGSARRDQRTRLHPLLDLGPLLEIPGGRALDFGLAT